MRIVTILLLLVASGWGEKLVKYAAIIYRHGDRTPVNTYPTDPWKNESLWPVPFGQLTNLGKNQHYALGKWIRKQYSMLISEKFDPKEIYVRSTDVDRTLMSAQTNLAGMYPPSGDGIWNPNLLWQPIPIHTRPEKDDEVLAMKRSCAFYNKEKDKYLNSKAYKERLSKYEGLMDYLTANTGKKIKDYEDISEIYSVLCIESLYNFTLPEWTRSVLDKLRQPSCYSFTTATATPIMSRLLTGPLLKEIVGKMKAVVTKKKPKPLKLSIYSGHDFTIGNVLSAMGMYDGNCPVYTATIIFELLQDSNTMDNYIRILYRNSTEIVKPHILNIPHCGQMCPYEMFIKLYENLLTVDWDHECTQPASPILEAIVCMGLLIFFFALYKVYDARSVHKRGNKVSTFFWWEASSVSSYHPTDKDVPPNDLGSP